MVQLADIERIALGVANLSPQEHEAIYRFTLLWTIFEAQSLQNSASVNKITDVVSNLDIHVVNGDWFHEQLEYFTERYIEAGNTNYRFDHLHLRNNDNPERVRSVLVGDNKDPKEQLIACLTIVYRFRNNFFHGLKWAYEMQDQMDNFASSASLLKACLEKIPNGR